MAINSILLLHLIPKPNVTCLSFSNRWTENQRWGNIWQNYPHFFLNDNNHIKYSQLGVLCVVVRLGQGSKLQPCFQNSPLLLDLAWVPPPQLTVHCDHSDQGPGVGIEGKVVVVVQIGPSWSGLRGTEPLRVLAVSMIQVRIWNKTV